MAGLTVQVVNLEQIFESLASLGPRMMAGAEKAALAEADFIFPITQEQVPKHTHALEKTGRVEEPDVAAGQITVAIAYGDDEVDYALPVHEDLEARHSNGKAKYVEDPVRAEMTSGRSAARMAPIIRAEVGLE